MSTVREFYKITSKELDILHTKVIVDEAYDWVPVDVAFNKLICLPFEQATPAQLDYVEVIIERIRR
jgi:hypothetical protein